MIAESDQNDPRLIRPVEVGGYGLDAQWSDDFHHALHSVLTGETSGYYSDFGSLADLAATLTRGYRYAGDFSRFRGRRHGRPNPALDGRQLLGYLQNHDQIGNRALGERSSALMSPGRLMIGAAVVLTAPFVPMLFQGEEWAASTPFLYFTDHQDHELGQAVSRGRREEFAAFGWDPERVPDPQDVASFERSKLNWSELDQPGHRRVLDWHRELIALRGRFPALTNGRLDEVAVDFSVDERWLACRRGRIVTAFNLSDTERRIPLRGDVAEIHHSTDGAPAIGRDGVDLPPDSVVVAVMEEIV